MAISGGAKFFKKSKNLLVDGASVSVGSGSSSADFMLDRTQNTYWRSVGSDDTTTETITITFPAAVTIDRLLLLDINWKDFNIQYDTGGGFTHFSSVVGLDGSKANITETAFADDSAYYEFASVSGVTDIRIQVTKSQVTDAEKYVSQVIATEELGTLQGWPEFQPIHSRNAREKETLSGRYSIDKSIDTLHLKAKLNNYPTSSDFTADLDLIYTLYDRDEGFLAWLCGGRRSTTYFRYALRGFRLRDAIEMKISKDLKPKYLSGIYLNPVSLNFTMRESI